MTKTKIYITLFLLMTFSLSFLATALGDVAPDLTDGLVLYYNFDEGQGITAFDSSGQENDGTLATAPLPAYITGKYLYALDFDGTQNYVVAAEDASLDLTETTISFWLNASSTVSYHDILWKGDAATTHNFRVRTYLTSIDFDFTNSTGTRNVWRSTAMSDFSNIQIFCVLTYTADTIQLFVNDLPVSGSWVTAQGKGAMLPNNNNLFVAKSIQGWYDGSIDDLRIYNRVLTRSEITFLYQNPQPTATPTTTPIVTDDTPTSTTLAFIVVLALIFGNILLLLIPSALMRFVFGVVSLSICGLALTYDLPFSPYLQLVGLLVSVLGMLAAARVRD